MKTALLISVMLSLGSFSTVKAQETFDSSGGTASGSGGSATYSVGQVFYTFTSSGFSVAEGVQQPFEISAVLNTLDAPEINLEMLVFPNPTSATLYLQYRNFTKQSSLKLFDIAGRILLSKEIGGVKTEIDMSSFASGTYLLQVLDRSKTLKTFKIIKK